MIEGAVSTAGQAIDGLEEAKSEERAAAAALDRAKKELKDMQKAVAPWMARR
jgi:hypothetical protein